MFVDALEVNRLISNLLRNAGDRHALLLLVLQTNLSSSFLPQEGRLFRGHFGSKDRGHDRWSPTCCLSTLDFFNFFKKGMLQQFLFLCPSSAHTNHLVTQNILLNSTKIRLLLLIYLKGPGSTVCSITGHVRNTGIV